MSWERVMTAARERALTAAPKYALWWCQGWDDLAGEPLGISVQIGHAHTADGAIYIVQSEWEHFFAKWGEGEAVCLDSQGRRVLRARIAHALHLAA